jgi:phage protein D
MNKYGPNTPKVELFIERLKVMTVEEAKRIAARSAAWDAARSAARDATRVEAWDAARDATRVEAWDAARVAARSAAWDAARSAAWDAAWDAARGAAWIVTAIVAMDLITEEQFQILTEPFAEILVELGIVWEGK